MSDGVETVHDDGRILAVIIRRNFRELGIRFFTSSDLSQQLGFMRHPSGTAIRPHYHNPVPREVTYTQEVLFLRSGRLRVDFFRESGDFLFSNELQGGDVILLMAGGHGFEVLEEVEMFEVKQGPYIGEQDKTLLGGKTD